MAACALLAPVPVAHADAELRVSPLIVDVDTEAGATVTETITATASGDEPITVELVHADFGFGEDYRPVLIRDDARETTAFSTRGWFSLPRQRYRIAAGKSLELPLRIEVPENTPGGTYLGAALLRVVPAERDLPGSQVQAVPETGPLYFIAVEGGDPPRPSISDYDVPGLVQRGPIRPSITVDNRGDEHFTFEGTVRLTGPGKDDEVDIARQYVVPGEPREVQTAAGAEDDEGIVELGSSELGLGKYTVTTRLRIEPTGTTLVERDTVWVIPTWARVLAAVLLLVLLGSIAALARWWMRRDPDTAALAEEDDASELVEDEASWTDDPLDDESLDEESLDDDGTYVS